MIGDVTQLDEISTITRQLTGSGPTAAMPAPMTAPTIAWVVETGALSQVARLTHKAAAISAAIMIQASNPSGTCTASTILDEMVFTTSPPAIVAPRISKIAAITSACAIVIARAPTAAPTLFVTSFAPIFIAM